MENSKAFSVCMAVYHKDNPEWFCQAVESVLNQTVKPDEIILVVDGPVPQPLHAVINEYKQRNLIKPIWLEKNQGLGNARRVAMQYCRNELIAMMDSDDISVSNRFELQLRAFELDHTLAIVGGQIEEFIESPDCPVGRRIVQLRDADIKMDLKIRCPLNHVTVMFRKKAVLESGGYLDWLYNEDYYLWIRMYLAGMKFANVPDVLVNVRVGEEMYRRRGGWKYFFSEFRIQNYMLNNHVIGVPTYFMNTMKRVIVQLLLPDCFRGWVFRKFARV